MFLARIDGNLVAVNRHPMLEGCRFLIGQRLEPGGKTSGEPLVILDWLGASRGSVVVVSTDGDITRLRLGNTTPARLVTIGILDGAVP
jgi:ethanolamine utilization protein EutN